MSTPRSAVVLVSPLPNSLTTPPQLTIGEPDAGDTLEWESDAKLTTEHLRWLQNDDTSNAKQTCQDDNHENCPANESGGQKGHVHAR